ncbi:bifunctional aminoglycoside phosphotransferase/ATP-binding protein [Accumulibacter sp.]|uniref:bifunctional aminoglycoside phosphotransferase/ATP-binding protein n=1 Tax=Accumulibacter sp. TaxID=2053492 RepID=UPI002623B1DF|nr:bifunctional aminoglycoside phosphotransferase/ATP-binding protein [Accumulibacter sp.]
MPQTLPPLIQALLEAGRYPDPAPRVDLVETHASWLLLAGDFAYKIKKPVTLPFLDYGTLARRKICCETELRLNRRVTPELYLDVVPIAGSPVDPRFDGSGPIIEYALKMHRFAEAGRLDHLCASGELRPQQLSQLAATLAEFHARAAVATPASGFGQPARILAQALDNFSELETLLPNDADQDRLARLRDWTRAEFERLAPLFASRQTDGRVRECHGDLHLGNLVLIDERVRLFDCIEFSEDLRWIDVASEIAFTYIDLLDQRRPSLGGWLANEWLSGSGDYGAAEVLRFYAVYRALVRAKVAAIRAAQAGDGAERAWHYLALADRLRQAPPARLVITHGVTGCGKSRASRRLLLADRTASTLRLRSDVERKRLFGLAPTARSGSPLDGGIYDRSASELTYRRLYDLARTLLAAGWSVIVDAAFLERRRRDAFHALAREAGVAFHIVAPQSTPAQLRARVRSRLAKGGNASEATLAVLDRQLASIEALQADEMACLL